jgi:hypothetical protein
METRTYWLNRLVAVAGCALALGGVAVAAPEPKVTICHFPPGNPANVQVITVGAPAVPAHVANHDDAVCPLGDSDCCFGGSRPSVCTDFATDVNNCGGCGTMCPTGATCTNGSCIAPAATNTATPANTPTNTGRPADTPTNTPTDTPPPPTQTPTPTNTPDPCVGKPDGATCDAATNGVVLTCEDEVCGPCVPQDSPSPRYVDNGNGTVTDRQLCLVWEEKTGAPSGDGLVECPNLATCPDPHGVNNLYSWTAAAGGTAFDGEAKTVFIDVLNDVAGGGTSCFAGNCDWRLPSIDELVSIVDCSGGTPCTSPLPGPTGVVDYWSSTDFPGDPTLALSDDYFSGGVDGIIKTQPRLVRAVRP